MPHHFNVGRKLKTLRQQNSLTLRDLSKKSGVSATQISDIERNLTSPTIATLIKLISALGQETSIFFENGDTKRISHVSKCQRMLVVDPQNDVHIESITSGIVDSKLKAIIAHPKPGQENIPGGYSHIGEELIYVIKGRVQVKLDDQSYTLEQGDCLHFRAEMRHTIKNITDDKVELLSVMTPPSY